jgi:hypothetical protein
VRQLRLIIETTKEQKPVELSKFMILTRFTFAPV